MCGIGGAFSTRPVAEVVERMTEAVRHRGPDDSGTLPLVGPDGSPAGAFGHRRLAVIDLSPAGHQPMTSGDGRFALTYNGEIYNFRALRRELEREGVRFTGESDTEVLLAGLARHGLDFVRRLEGMYAFAFWDVEKGGGWLVRDPFGIKPLYLTEVDGEVLFASELRALLASGRVERRIDDAGLASFLAWGSPAEPRTLVEGVRALPAGAAVEVTCAGGRFRTSPVRRVADMLPAGPGAIETEMGRAADRVREALRDAVASHLVSDVPIGFLLSGGLDSSALVALASETHAGPIETFTVGFREASYDERAPAAEVARAFGARHNEIELSAGDFLAGLTESFAAMDQPSMDGLNTFVVSRAVRQRGIKVVLSGLGGDELFGGYPSFRRARWAASLARVPLGLRRPAAGALGAMRGARAAKLAMLAGAGPDPAAAAYAASRALFGPAEVVRLAGARRGHAVHELAPAPAGLSPLRRVSWYEVTGYMRNTLLRDSDVFSMAHGLELRVPFVSAGVAAAAAGIDDRLLLDGGVGKAVLVAALRDRLPRSVWDRPKQGFVLPFAEWMRGPLEAEIGRAFERGRLGRLGIDPEAAREAWARFRAGAGAGWARPWALYTLVRWAEENAVSFAAAGAPADEPETAVAR